MLGVEVGTTPYGAVLARTESLSIAVAEKGLSGSEIDRRVKTYPEPSFRPVLLANSLLCMDSIAAACRKAGYPGTTTSSDL